MTVGLVSPNRSSTKLRTSVLPLFRIAEGTLHTRRNEVIHTGLEIPDAGYRRRETIHQSPALGGRGALDRYPLVSLAVPRRMKAPAAHGAVGPGSRADAGWEFDRSRSVLVRADAMYAVASVLYIIGAATLLVVVYRSVVQGWVAQFVSESVAAVVGWALAGVYVLVTVAAVAADLRRARRSMHAPN